MGQAASIPLEDCVRLDPSNEDYMVKRTSGVWESGWAFSDKGHACSVVQYDGPVASLIKYDDTFVWSIYVTNGSVNPNTHACKWCRLVNMYPSRLSGDQVEIDKWREDMTKLLENTHEIQREIPTFFKG